MTGSTLVTQKVSTEGADLLTLAGVNDANLIELGRIHGVRVGVITYSYRGGNINTAEETLKALLEDNTLCDETHSTLSTVFRNEYKRQQGPIILKLSAKAFGSGRQFLVTQSSSWTHLKQTRVNKLKAKQQPTI